MSECDIYMWGFYWVVITSLLGMAGIVWCFFAMRKIALEALDDLADLRRRKGL